MPARISLGRLLVFVACCGLGLGALRDPQAWWASGLAFGAIAAVGLAALGAATGRGSGWLGFALAGGLYLTLAFAPWSSTEVRPLLPTTWAIDRFEAVFARPIILKCPDDFTTVPGVSPAYPISGFQRWNTPPTFTFMPPPAEWWPAMTDQQQVGHALLGLLAGALGRLTARRKGEPPTR